MSLPNQLNQALVPGSTLASDIDLKFTQLITAIEDILGVPDVTNISAAALEVVAAGLKSITLQDAAADPAVAGKLQRNAALLKWHNGTAAKQIAFNGDAPAAHEASHKSGGSDAFLSTDLLEAIVKRVQESGGPTTLTLGSIADTQFLKRSGSTIIGSPSAGGLDTLATARFYEDFISCFFGDTTNKYFVSQHVWTDPPGGFPSVATTAVTNSTGGTSFTVNMPASIAAGDLLIASVHQRNQQVLTWPSGWTSLVASNGTSQRLEVRYKIADGTEGSTITITAGSTTGDATASAYRITGHDPARAPTVGTSAQASSTAPDPPSVTANANENNLFVEVIGAGAGSGTLSISAWSTNYGSNQIQGSGTNTTCCGMATRNFAAGSDDPGTATISTSTQWITNTIAVSPLPGGSAAQFTNATNGGYKPSSELINVIVTNGNSSITRSKPFVQSKNPVIKINQAQDTTSAGTRRFGLVDGSIASAEPSNGIYFRHSAAGNYIAVCRNSGTESTLDTAVAAANGVFHTFELVVVGTTSVTVFVDGNSKGTISTNIPTVNLGFAANPLQTIDFVSVEQNR